MPLDEGDVHDTEQPPSDPNDSSDEDTGYGVHIVKNKGRTEPHPDEYDSEDSSLQTFSYINLEISSIPSLVCDSTDPADLEPQEYRLKVTKLSDDENVFIYPVNTPEHHISNECHLHHQSSLDILELEDNYLQWLGKECQHPTKIHPFKCCHLLNCCAQDFQEDHHVCQYFDD